MAADGALKILIIEDDADTRANLRDILELDGHQIDEAATAAAALDRQDWSGYATILLDRNLPDRNAGDLLPRLRRSGAGGFRDRRHRSCRCQRGDRGASPGGRRLLAQADRTRRAARSARSGYREAPPGRRLVANPSCSPGPCSTRSVRTSRFSTTPVRSSPSTRRGAISPRRTGRTR